VSVENLTSEKLAILGGPKANELESEEIFRWPITTAEDEQAVLEVIRAGSMSAWDISRKFEEEWGEYLGRKFNLSYCNGTMALMTAMFAVGVGRGDEVIVPSITYWASGLQTHLLGATPVFADIDPVTLCIDPRDIERRITPRTRAIVAVHYCGHPAEMDAILEIARKHKLKVIEDCSHAHGGLYKGEMIGTLGDVAGFSMMASKSFAIGEAGMLSTNSREIYERAIAFSHYERTKTDLTLPDLKRVVAADGFVTGLPLGAVKGRINQTCSAMGRVQLKYYPQRMQEIQKAMNRFWDLLEGVPGLRAHRPQRYSGSTMGGWYNPIGHYVAAELGGLPVRKFIDAVQAEGGHCGRGGSFPLHLHPVLNEADIFHDGKPTRIAFTDRDVRQKPGSLPVSEHLAESVLGMPWFKHDWPEEIERYAAAYRKVANSFEQLL